MEIQLRRLATFSALALIGLGTTAAFAAERYSCTFSERSNRGPVPTTIDLRLDLKSNTAQIQDIYTKQITSTPMPAQIDRISPSKIDVKWKLVGISYQGSETKITGGIVDYKLSVNLTSKKAKLAGVSREYYSRIYGEGSCIRTK